MADTEPTGEPPAATAAPARLRAAADAAVPPVRALLDDKALLPQQALGVLNAVEGMLNRILVSLSDADDVAKFSRVKLSALRKQAGSGIICVATEHLHWGPEGPDALAAALAVRALISQVQEVAKTKGLRALAGPLDLDCATRKAALTANFGDSRLLEPRNHAGPRQANSNEQGWLLSRSWLQENLPQLATALQELPALFEPAAIFASRERSAKASVCRALAEARAAQGLGESARLVSAPLLAELAQLSAGAELVRLRKPELFRLPKAAPEPDVEPTAGEQEGEQEPAELPSVGAEQLLVPALAGCIPAMRLGLPYVATSHILRLAEAPAFFTMDEKEKAFQISVTALGEAAVASWLSKPALAEALMRPDACVVGVGCSLDIGGDDKAILFVVVA